MWFDVTSRSRSHLFSFVLLARSGEGIIPSLLHMTHAAFATTFACQRCGYAWPRRRRNPKSLSSGCSHSRFASSMGTNENSRRIERIRLVALGYTRSAYLPTASFCV